MSMLSRVIDYDMKNGVISPSHIYMDLDVTNNDFNNQTPKPLSFTESRTTNIIEDASLYYMSIIRWHLDTLSLPVWCPQIQLNNANDDPNLTIYSFTMTYKTYTYQQFLDFVPQDQSMSPPASSATQNIDSGYYYVYSYCYVVDLLNNTIQSCFDGLKALVEAGADTLPSDIAPSLCYDPSSSSLSMFSDVLGYSNLLENPINMYANTACYNMLSGFEYIKKGYIQPSGMNFQFKLHPTVWNITEFASYNAISTNEEYNCISTWSPVQKIVFTSPNLPIVPSIVSSASSFNSTTSFNQNGGNDKMNIITDMEMAMSSGKEWLPSVNYSPYKYRLISLQTHNPINQISINIFWRDIYGNMHTLYLPSGNNASLKILFIKKSFYSNRNF